MSCRQNILIYLCAKWQQLPNSDKDLFPLLECFTSIPQVLLFSSVKGNLVVLKSELALPKYQSSAVLMLEYSFCYLRHEDRGILLERTTVRFGWVDAAVWTVARER
jgi:hypothetical protein